MMTRVTINGESSALEAANVIELLQASGIDPKARGVAVALNGSVVPRRHWAGQAIADGDRIEIVKPFAGG